MEKVFLSRRNLLTLISKLDRKKSGEGTACTIIKNDTIHSEFPCSNKIQVTAVEDEVYYKDRNPGEIHPSDLKL